MPFQTISPDKVYEQWEPSAEEVRKKQCGDCPFRFDAPLGFDRDGVAALVDRPGVFLCHETFHGAASAQGPWKNESLPPQQCLGHVRARAGQGWTYQS